MMNKDLRRKMKFLAREMRRNRNCSSYIEYILKDIGKKPKRGSKKKLNDEIKKLKAKLLGRFRDFEMPYLVGCIKDADI